MIQKYAILIDAGFLRAKISTKDNPITLEDIRTFVKKLSDRDELNGHILHRIYYYDAEPLAGVQKNPISGESINFTESEVYKRNKFILEELKKEPYFAVRLGETNFRGWNLAQRILRQRRDKSDDSSKKTINASDLKPNVQQKGVDMRIALDISSMSLKHQVDLFVLVSGDSDFVPIIKFARVEGRQVFLYTLGHDVKPSMFEHSDMVFSTPLNNL
ncbi:NYN domain-containing protein [Morganella morganii]|uniref:NYN domain-containing protein n=1 Tax=Morganella morganii TaxID=582 RepID=UPI003EC0FF32